MYSAYYLIFWANCINSLLCVHYYYYWWYLPQACDHTSPWMPCYQIVAVVPQVVFHLSIYPYSQAYLWPFDKPNSNIINGESLWILEFVIVHLLFHFILHWLRSFTDIGISLVVHSWWWKTWYVWQLHSFLVCLFAPVPNYQTVLTGNII